MWVQVLDVSSRDVTLQRDGRTFVVRWPGPLPFVGGMRVIGLIASDTLHLGRNAQPAGSTAELVARAVLEVVLRERHDGVGVFEADGCTVELALTGTAWEVGARYRVGLDALEAFDRLVA